LGGPVPISDQCANDDDDDDDDDYDDDKVIQMREGQLKFHYLKYRLITLTNITI
jgi:hypothetical protein